MSSFLSHRRRAFAAAGGGDLPTPLHWWDLDDLGTGTGAGLDDQGSGTNDMTLTSFGSVVAESGVAPDGGDALLFDGINDYVYTTSDFTWDGDPTAMSISIWAQIDSSIDDARMFSWRDTNGDRLVDLLRLNSNGYVKAAVWDDTDSAKVTTDDAGLALATGADFYHVVLTWLKGGTMEMYVDGSIVAGASTSTVGVSDLEDTNTMQFTIGAFSSNRVILEHAGNLWSCGVWDAELTSDEVSTLYNSGTGGKYADYTWT